MVSALDSRLGSSVPGWSPRRGHCVVFLGNTPYSQCLSPPRCINGTGEPNVLLGVISIPSRGNKNTSCRFMLLKLG